MAKSELEELKNQSAQQRFSFQVPVDICYQTSASDELHNRPDVVHRKPVSPDLND